MPVPKQDKPLLTATEKERLADMQLDPNIRKRNDMIVRNKILSWIGNADDVLFALEHLPIRKLKKEFNDDRIYKLLAIVRELLDIKDFCKLYDTGKRTIAVKQFSEHHNPKFFVGPIAHNATNEDFNRIYMLETSLEEIKSLLPELDQNPAYERYKEEQLELLSDLIAKSTVNGKQPSEADFWDEKGCQILFGNPSEHYPKSTRHIEKSINYFDKAIEVEPNHMDALMNKTYALGELGAYEEAIKCMDKVISISPQNSEIWRQRAIYNSFILNYEECLKNLTKSLDIDPSNTPAIIMKIDILKELGRESEAFELISRHFKKDKALIKFHGWLSK